MNYCLNVVFYTIEPRTPFHTPDIEFFPLILLYQPSFGLLINNAGKRRRSGLHLDHRKQIVFLVVKHVVRVSSIKPVSEQFKQAHRHFLR